MYFRTASAAFVVAQSPALSAQSALRATGLESGTELREQRAGFGVHDPGTPAFEGDWPAVGRTWGRVDPIGDHQLVQLFFSYSAFVELWSEERDVPLEDDPLKPLADAFAAAAERLDAEVGWIDGNAHYGDEDWETRSGSQRVNAASARAYLGDGRDALLEARFSLTWMRQDVAADWGPDFTRAFQTTDAGWLLWAGEASSRWF